MKILARLETIDALWKQVAQGDDAPTEDIYNMAAALDVKKQASKSFEALGSMIKLAEKNR